MTQRLKDRMRMAVNAVKGGIGCRAAARLYDVGLSTLEKHCKAVATVTSKELAVLDTLGRADFDHMLLLKFPRAEAFGYAVKDMRLRQKREARRCA